MATLPPKSLASVTVNPWRLKCWDPKDSTLSLCSPSASIATPYGMKDCDHDTLMKGVAPTATKIAVDKAGRRALIIFAGISASIFDLKSGIETSINKALNGAACLTNGKFVMIGKDLIFTEDGKQYQCESEEMVLFKDIAVHPTESQCAVDSTLGICLFNTSTMDFLTSIHNESGPYDYCNTLSYFPDGRLITKSSSGKLRVVDIQKKHNLHTINATSFALSPSGEILATADQVSHRINIWETTTFKKQCRLSPPHPVSCMTFTPAGDRLVIGHEESVEIWDIKSGNMLWTFTPEKILTAGAPSYLPLEGITAMKDGSLLLAQWKAATRLTITAKEVSK